MKTKLTPVSVSGSHREVGFAIGQTFQEQIARSLEQSELLQQQFLPYVQTPEGQLRYERLRNLHVSRCPNYMAELEGIAQGAEQRFKDVFIINMRGEYRNYVQDEFGCSTCSLLTGESAVFGHNEDGFPLYDDSMYVVRVSIPGKPEFVAFCYPGFLPGNAFGFNSEGICFSINNVQPKHMVEGIGRHFIGRSLFEARSLDEAIQCTIPAGRASGFNYTICSLKERRLVDVEVAPESYDVTEIQGSYFHTNHYQKLPAVEQIIGQSSRARQERGQELLADGQVTHRDGVLHVLRDRQHETHPILRDGTPPDQAMTYVTALFDLDAKTLSIYSAGGVEDGKFETLLELSMLG